MSDDDKTVVGNTDDDRTVVSDAQTKVQSKTDNSKTRSTKSETVSNDYPPTIGKYKVLGVLAKGGMGVVYRAIHPSLKRYVVIKKMTARNRAGNGERFKKEAQILLDLQSPYIVHLFDYFTEEGYRYMVEELVDGQALDNLIKKQVSLPTPVAMLIMQDACFALKYAHSKNIVHRDIKPGNILISKRGEIKLADFGIASDQEDTITQTGTSLGTPAYMPPEQWEDSAHVTNTADIYALGIMLYEMLTGSKPYPGTFSVETLNTIKKGKYINPRKIDSSIPKEVCRLIRKMIKPKSKNRYQSVEDVIVEVKKYLKHYDTHELRVQVAKSVVTTKEYKFEGLEPKDVIKRRIRTIVLSVAAALVVFAGCWKAGFIHRTILRHWYTPVKIEMVMPTGLTNNLDLPARCFFFENDNDKLPEVNGASKNFTVKGSRFSEKSVNLFRKYILKQELLNLDPKNTTYSMPTVFLKHGDYRVKVVIGPYVWWKNFTVDSDAQVIPCDFLKNTVRNLTVNYQIFDSETGEDISKYCEFKVLYKNKWVLIEEMPPETLKTASVWKIRITSEYFEQQYYSLLIDWYQDNITISTNLKMKEGVVLPVEE